jgi:protein-tyrosine phosphatase
MYKITPYLYLSNAYTANTQPILSEHNIIHIINLTAEHPNYYPTSYTYLRIPARDTLHERLSPYFPRITAFVASARDSHGVALVHCAEGVSRSVTGVLAALMVLEGMHLGEALAHVRRVRTHAEPNRAFLRELRALEARLWEGEWTREKLTMVDDGRAPRLEEEWRDEVMDVLAAAAMGEEGVKADGWGEDVVLERGKGVALVAVRGREGDSEVSVEARLMELIALGLENYGGRNEKDVRARDMLKTMVVSLVGIVFKREIDLGKTLNHMRQSEDWRELTIDVPVAEDWVKQLLHDMEANHADANNVKTSSAGHDEKGEVND